MYRNIANRVIKCNADALLLLADNISDDLSKFVTYILSLSGRIITTGMGKSGHIARKIAASLSSIGVPAYYMHPADASHGDLGMITQNDVLLALSNSGETKELNNVINYCKRFGIKIAGMTMQANSTLATSSDFLLLIPKVDEASSIDAPTTSILMMLSLGDALVVIIQEIKGISRDQFRTYHPGGKIGAGLLKIADIMHRKMPLIYCNTQFLDIMIIMTQRRFGCALIVDDDKKLIGIITDGDLRRKMNHDIYTKCAYDLMTANPKSILSSRLAYEALSVMNENKITVLPVIDNQYSVVGLIHIHDLLTLGVI